MPGSKVRRNGIMAVLLQVVQYRCQDKESHAHPIRRNAVSTAATLLAAACLKRRFAGSRLKHGKPPLDLSRKCRTFWRAGPGTPCSDTFSIGATLASLARYAGGILPSSFPDSKVRIRS